jgi:type IX secretion system substrate protein
MKTLKLLFLSFIFLFPFHKLNSQPQYYFEQSSGVTENLTSVCMLGSNAIQVWICGNSGTVLKSLNQGTNWLIVGNSGIPSAVNLVNINCSSYDTVLTAGNIGSNTYVYRTTNGGVSWAQIFTQSNGTINAVWMKTALLGFMCGNPVGGRWSLWKTINGGLNWDSTGLYLPQAGSETGWNNSLEIKNNNIWFGTNNSRIYYSSNYGSSWLIKSTSPEINSSAEWHYAADSLFSFLGGTGVYKTSNDGVNWIQLPCPGTGNFKGFCIGPMFLFNSSWPGPTFTVRGTTNVYLNWMGNQFLVDYTAPSGNYNHISYSNALFSYSAPINSWAVRSNGGITKLFTGRGTSVNMISSDIPVSYNLEQNYPNPFNPSTKIRFSIPPSEVKGSLLTKIIIYDILGREVKTLVNESLTPGIYETDFDAAELSSGMYFYTMVVTDISVPSGAGFTDTKRMVLIK